MGEDLNQDRLLIRDHSLRPKNHMDYKLNFIFPVASHSFLVIVNRRIYIYWLTNR